MDWPKRLCPATAAMMMLLAVGTLRAQQTPSAFHHQLVQAQAELGAHHYDKARKLFQHANKLVHNSSAECYAGEATADLRLQKFKDAAKAATRARACADSPTAQANAENLLGVAQMQRAAHEHKTKWLQQAIATLQSAVKLAPTSGPMHFNLGVALLRDQQIPLGYNELQQSLLLDPQGTSAPLARRYLKNPDSALPGYWPAFSFTASNGQVYAPRALTGKVVLLDFWGSWCPPCRESVGELRSLWRQYFKRKFVLVSVDVGDKQPVWRQYIAKHQMNWPQYWDGAGYTMQRTFHVREFPTFIIADSHGIIRFRTFGEGPDISEALESELRSLVK